MKGKFATNCYCCSITQLVPTLCDAMDCSLPGLSVPHHLTKFAQVHVHCIGDAIQPSHNDEVVFVFTSSLHICSSIMPIHESVLQKKGVA